jgi:hypothetical protein
MSWEAVLFNSDNVLLTNQRFSVGRRTFSMESIQSAEVIYRGRNWMPMLALLLMAGSLELCGLSLEIPGLQVAAVMTMMLVATVFWKGGPRYTIALDTPQGQIKPLTSSDRQLVESVGQVMQFTLQRAGEERSPWKDPISTAAHRRSAFQVLPGKFQVHAQDDVFRGKLKLQVTVRPRLFAVSRRSTPHTAA